MNTCDLNEKEYIKFIDSYIENFIPGVKFECAAGKLYESTQEELYDELVEGDEMEMNVFFIKPNQRSGEWECAGDGNGMTSGAIEITKKYGSFVVEDGHHRLYEAVKSGKKKVAIKIVNY